jgi:hypothetical protein
VPTIDLTDEENLMADFSCASIKRTSYWPAPISWEASVRLRVSVVVAALVLSGCNANQAVNPSSQTKTWEGDHYVDDNPYNPISYAQNNTGNRGGGH